MSGCAGIWTQDISKAHALVEKIQAGLAAEFGAGAGPFRNAPA
jgi:hypothetical protein